ncbi:MULTISPECIES: hypothetical protein [Brevundimonas]|uniref:Uncharacterized protein n=1 Tax=Brevundimonas abyssalis TAR-001 TaxID=1391729 RepID=A0A8E0N8J4_9CAUL|nr:MULTISPECIES: hypothetical protein [Brevundimonas]GAD58619.1 hypothetical protein MBEBAB_0869 [Brevundimonas abyssalis TAR-001]
MTSGIIQNLAHAARTVADHPDPSARFGMAVGFICDIALQNDIDGLWIASSAACSITSTRPMRRTLSAAWPCPADGTKLERLSTFW